MDVSISRQLARFALGLQYEDLPGEVIHEAKRHLYDTIGCAFGGFHTRGVQIVRRIYRQLEGTHEATLLVSGERLPAVSATLVNSLAVRALDFNDLYVRSDPAHPSDLIPAALATGEMMGATMKAVIVAIVLAYEIEQRLCEFAVPGLAERKWHHATLTQFVSPLVAGKLMGLSEDQLVHALGIAGSHSHTIGAPATGQLTMMKNTVDPMAVRHGVFAALLAKEDYTGTENIFEGEEGLMDVYGPDWDVSKLVDGLGESYKIMACSMKAFPTDVQTHSHLTAAIKVVAEHDLQPEDVEQVVVLADPATCERFFGPASYEPASRETADQSLPYCLAWAILERAVTIRIFDDERFDNPRWKGLIHKIKGEASEAFEGLSPDMQPSTVTIRTTKGEEHTVHVEYPRGDPREPLTEEEQDDKFRDLTAAHLSEEGRQRIKEAIFHCETLAGVHQFMALMVGD